MAKPKSHKDQHFVPVGYLKAWCDPDAPEGYEPYLWLFEKDRREGRKKAPKNVLCENEMYTVRRSDGTRDLKVEEGLNRLETAFIRIRDSKIEQLAVMEPEEFVTLCAFAAAMYARTPQYRAHTQEQWGHALRVMDDLQEKMRTATPGQREAAARISRFTARDRSRSLTHGQVTSLVKHPLPITVPSMIKNATPILAQMDAAILRTDDEAFITSDAPCVWFDPQAYKRPPMLRGVGLGWPTVEVSLPLSPRYCLLLNRFGMNGFVRVKARQVSELNRRTRFQCHEHFVANKDGANPYWFRRRVGK